MFLTRLFSYNFSIIFKIRVISMQHYDLLYKPYSNVANCPHNILYSKRKSQVYLVVLFLQSSEAPLNIPTIYDQDYSHRAVTTLQSNKILCNLQKNQAYLLNISLSIKINDYTSDYKVSRPLFFKFREPPPLQEEKTQFHSVPTPVHPECLDEVKSSPWDSDLVLCELKAKKSCHFLCFSTDTSSLFVHKNKIFPVRVPSRIVTNQSNQLKVIYLRF